MNCRYLFLLISCSSIYSCNRLSNADPQQVQAGTKSSQVTQQIATKSFDIGYKMGFDAGYKKGFAEGFVRYSTDTSNIKIHVNDIKKLVAELIYFHSGASATKPTTNERVISRKFEAYAILNSVEPTVSYEYVKAARSRRSAISDEEFYDYFIVQDTVRVPETNELLAVMHNVTGYEFIPYVFAVFELNRDELRLKGLLDGWKGVGIGSLKIDQIIKVSSDNYLLRGQSGGGDAGYAWKAIWFGYWNRPYHLIWLYENQCEYYSGTHQKEIDHLLNITDFKALIHIKERKVSVYANDSTQYSDWEIVESDTIDLKYLMRITHEGVQ